MNHNDTYEGVSGHIFIITSEYVYYVCMYGMVSWRPRASHVVARLGFQ